MNNRKILVVEDDAAIRQGIVDALEFAGFTPLEASDGHKGLVLAREAECDLVLLDLVLPGPDGLEILKAVRLERPTLPVIIMTARGEEKDRVRGLQLGADDYVVKPFSVKELLARVSAVLRAMKS
jgi:DNA-binding response OmpR family regulator